MLTLLRIRTAPRRPKRCVLPLHQTTTTKPTCFALLNNQSGRTNYLLRIVFCCSCLEHILKESYVFWRNDGDSNPEACSSQTDRLAICSNTNYGTIPFYYIFGGSGETRTHTPRVTGPSVFKTAAAMPIRLTLP